MADILERPTVLIDADASVDIEENRVLAALAASLASEARLAERLVARLEVSVAQGDRMLAELGIAQH